MRKVPTCYKPSLVVLDTTNLQALLSTPMRVSLPLVDVLKVRPKLWHKVVKCLSRMGIEMSLVQEMRETMVVDPIKKLKCKPIPLNKVGDYNEGNKSNITLPIEFNKVQSLAILDSRARVALIMIQV